MAPFRIVLMKKGILQKSKQPIGYHLGIGTSNARCLLPTANCLLLALLFLLASCANPIPPEGGPKDNTPPKLDSLHSTRNFQTRFKKQDIVLAFDEWVELKDVFTQVVISPPLAKRPEIVRRKKSVQVIFAEDEVLRDSATYVINFGQAIVDLTEGNVNPYVFVFSTGDYIDSLTVEGKIVDAWTEKPVEKTLFMLYENTADSVVRTERPFYFALTDKEGNFKVQNIKSGTFKVFALNDLNLNYRFDSDAEQIGFLDSLLALSGDPIATISLDSTKVDSLRSDSLAIDSLATKPLPATKPPTPRVSLRLFTEDKPLFLRSKDATKYGQVKLGFNQPPIEAKVSYDSLGQVVFQEMDKDTLRLWYHHPAQDTSFRVFVQRDTSTDTIFVKSGLRAGFLTSTGLKTVNKPIGPPVKLAPAQPLLLAFRHPLASLNPENMRLLEDTSKTVVKPNLSIDSVEKRSLKLNYPWKEGIAYELELLPGSATDIFGLSNTDTLVQKINVGTSKDYGLMTLRAVRLDSSKAYVLRLLDKPDGTPLRTWEIADLASFEVKLPLLPPATYTAELIEDLDRNGRWTTGSYDRHRQPEKFVRKTLEELRANWELEAEVGF